MLPLIFIRNDHTGGRMKAADYLFIADSCRSTAVSSPNDRDSGPWTRGLVFIGFIAPTHTYSFTYAQEHTYTHTHTQTHEYTHTYTRTSMRAHIRTRTHTNTHSHTHAHAHVSTFARTSARPQTHARSHIHIRTIKQAHTYVDPHTHTHAYTYKHPHAHKCKYTQTQTCRPTHAHTTHIPDLLVLFYPRESHTRSRIETNHLGQPHTADEQLIRQSICMNQQVYTITVEQ